MSRYLRKNGYIDVYIDGKQMRESRYVWAQHHGEIPKGAVIHHKNGNKADNRIENLQMVSSNGYHRWLYHSAKKDGATIAPFTIQELDFARRRLPLDRVPKPAER